MSKKLPLLISVPHPGLLIPAPVRHLSLLSPAEIEAESDASAAEIYDLERYVEQFITTDVARVIVDLNRAENDRSMNGVVKTHTSYGVPVYKEPLSEEVITLLLKSHYHPYHRKLSRFSNKGLLLAVDCHTMAEQGPPLSPDPDQDRPWVCLSNGDDSLPGMWFQWLANCFREVFGGNVSLNHPFRGGYITRSHSREMHWVQVELSRAPFMNNREKREAVLEALRSSVAHIKGVRQ